MRPGSSRARRRAATSGSSSRPDGCCTRGWPRSSPSGRTSSTRVPTAGRSPSGSPSVPYEDLRAAGLASIADRLDDTPLGPDQLVHADLAGNVLLDARGSAVVIDVSPAWRPVRWAEAVCVLDAVVRFDVPERAVVEWGAGDRRQAMLRALAFRWLSDPDPAPYEPLLALL
ncbi:hypothetical protein GCM10011519_11460 [Marmoricola endophyticus]|uniref:Uncharacterized protein n=1 Tax=Marmoricola endophyticus TaxID=2040280 RepID=A0A917F3H5_9ACTN|nr:hypothetical protein [Marmoricola endophyticus]GGF39534.1 hypothetical protein GCM10011519_11460 [Marmoricola endophyticus]